MTFERHPMPRKPNDHEMSTSIIMPSLDLHCYKVKHSFIKVGGVGIVKVFVHEVYTFTGEPLSVALLISINVTD